MSTLERKREENISALDKAQPQRVGSVLLCVGIIWHKGGVREKKMREYYILAPFITETKTPIKCKVQRIRCAKRNEVPIEYRKIKFKKLRDWLFYTKQDITNFVQRRNYYGKEKC